MIQRIQTIYLLISIALVALLFALPFAEIAREGALYLFNFKGVSQNGTVTTNGFVIPVMIVVVLALNGLAVFSYKNRKSQVKLIVSAIVVLAALLGIFIFYTSVLYSGSAISYKIGMVFPLLAIILNYLAIQGIRKDEALIRSIDRIR